jgi:hypothetical protein
VPAGQQKYVFFFCSAINLKFEKRKRKIVIYVI